MNSQYLKDLQNIKQGESKAKYDQSKINIEKQILEKIKIQYQEAKVVAKKKNDDRKMIENDLKQADIAMNQMAENKKLFSLLENRFQNQKPQKFNKKDNQEYLSTIMSLKSSLSNFVDVKKQFPVKVNNAFLQQIQLLKSLAIKIEENLSQLNSLNCFNDGPLRNQIKTNFDELKQSNYFWVQLSHLEAREGYQEIHHAPEYIEQDFKNIIQHALQENYPKEQAPQVITKEVVKYQERTISMPVNDRMREGHEKMFGIGRPQNIQEALSIYLEEAQKYSNVLAYNTLGQLYYEGKFIPQDLKKASTYFQTSASKQDAHGWYYLGKMIEHGQLDDQNITALNDFKQYTEAPQIFKAMICYEKAAQDNHLDALTDLGYIYEKGIKSEDNSNQWLIEPDWNRAYENYYRKAKKARFPRALNNLGLAFLKGQNIPFNLKNEITNTKALKYIEIAYDSGYVKAAYNLGVCYEKGLGGIKIDLQKAKALFYEAGQKGDIEGKMFHAYYILKDASQSDNETQYIEAIQCLQDVIKLDKSKSDAYYYLGFLFENGLGVSTDLKLAFRYFNIGAKLKHPLCLNRLGDYFSSGFGGNNPNKELAIQYYEQAANLNNINALLNLGALYEEGSMNSIPDYKLAYEYYQRAMRLGEPKAYLNIGLMYQLGRYVEQNEDEANKYFLKAANNNIQTAIDILVNKGLYDEFTNQHDQDLDDASFFQQDQQVTIPIIKSHYFSSIPKKMMKISIQQQEQDENVNYQAKKLFDSLDKLNKNSLPSRELYDSLKDTYMSFGLERNPTWEEFNILNESANSGKLQLNQFVQIIKRLIGLIQRNKQ